MNDSEQQPKSLQTFRMLKPAALKTLLSKGLGPKIRSIVLFRNIEGSIIASVGKDDSLHSQAAVLANISHEYIEFGGEAFNKNVLQAFFLQHDNVSYVAKPIYNLILCFVCENDANLGLIRNKIEVMSGVLEESMEGLKDHLVSRHQDEEEQE